VTKYVNSVSQVCLFCGLSNSDILLQLSFRSITVSWLRHYATSQNVARSISDGVTGIFHWHNPSGRTMALGGRLSL